MYVMFIFCDRCLLCLYFVSDVCCVGILWHMSGIFIFFVTDVCNVYILWQIKEYLDKHVIGQDLAKRRLSVAVYYHYKKVQHNMKNSKSADKSSDSYRELTSRGMEENLLEILY